MKLLFTILLTTILSVYPQQLYEKQIIPFDGEANDSFGRDVAICDSFIFIGSRGDDNYSGSVYVYKKENNDWIFWKKLFASDKRELSFFGSVILLEENKLFIGAGRARVNNISSGAVYFFKYEDGDWVEKQKIVPPVLQFEGNFSSSITTYQNYLLVGAYNYNHIYEYAGKVFLYTKNNNSYTFIQEIVPSDPQYVGRFGSAVAIDNNLVLVGSIQDSTPSGAVSGSVYSFIKDDSLWREKEKFLPDSNSANLGYGCAIVMDTNYIFIGAYGEIGYVGSGLVYIYGKDMNNIKFFQKINSGEGYNYDSFGFPLALNGDSLLIGAFTDTTRGIITGSAYLFVNKNRNWTKIKKLTPSDEENAYEYGISLDFINGNILLGASRTLVNGERIGKAYLYNDKPLSLDENLFSDKSEFNLFQNYPNPFNPVTNIKYTITRNQRISLKVYDVLGKEVITLVNEEQPAGEYKIQFDGGELASGIYFYKLKAGGFIQAKKAILIK